jgi:hypothetical protein
MNATCCPKNQNKIEQKIEKYHLPDSIFKEKFLNTVLSGRFS